MWYVAIYWPRIDQTYLSWLTRLNTEFCNIFADSSDVINNDIILQPTDLANSFLDIINMYKTDMCET